MCSPPHATCPWPHQICPRGERGEHNPGLRPCNSFRLLYVHCRKKTALDGSPVQGRTCIVVVLPPSWVPQASCCCARNAGSHSAVTTTSSKRAAAPGANRKAAGSKNPLANVTFASVRLFSVTAAMSEWWTKLRYAVQRKKERCSAPASASPKENKLSPWPSLLTGHVGRHHKLVGCEQCHVQHCRFLCHCSGARSVLRASALQRE